MLIVHVVRQFAPSVGGLEDTVANLCRELARREDVKIRIVTLDRVFAAPQNRLPARETIDGLEIVRLPFFGSKRYPLAPGVLGAVRDADLIHVHAIDFFFDFLALTKLLHRKPLVASTHGGFFHTSFAARLKKIYFGTVTRLSARAYDVLCASSDNDAATFREIAEDKVVAIENGVNIGKWRDAGSKEPQRTMICIGRWAVNKRLPLLIALIAALRKLDPAWRLIVAGAADRETRESLAALAREAGAEDGVTIAERPGDDEMKALIGQASYIVSASSYEGFGLTAIEGLSAGLIPLLTPLPPFKKIVDLLGFGVLWPADDLAAAARRIEDAHRMFAADGADRRARCLALSDFYAWPGVADRFYEIYKRLCRPGSPRRPSASA